MLCFHAQQVFLRNLAYPENLRELFDVYFVDFVEEVLSHLEGRSGTLVLHQAFESVSTDLSVRNAFHIDAIHFIVYLHATYL